LHAGGRSSIQRSGTVLRTDSVDDLTPRERDVLRHVALGKSNKDIAAALDISEETVKTHVRHVLAKLGAENRAQAAVRALARGVVSPEDLAGD
jgi:DNA-binding NarL/FixJ family response regulator